MSRLKITLHKKGNVMEEIKKEYVTQNQKDYSKAFKLSVVFEIGREDLSIIGIKYSTQGVTQ